MSAKTFGELIEFTPLFDHLVGQFGLSTGAVYGRIWRYTRLKDGCCWASVKTIARELRLNERTVRRHLDQLVESGYLTRTKRKGQTDEFRIIRSGTADILSAPTADILSAPPRTKSPRTADLKSDERDYKRQQHRDEEARKPRAADSPAHRSKADRLAGDHQVLDIMTGLGISDGQARKFSVHFTPSEAEAIANVARRQEPVDLGAYAAQLFRDHLQEAERD